jgi:uroporphyrinogen-III synthase
MRSQLVLLTRPLTASMVLRTELALRGVPTALMPLLHYRPLKADYPPIERLDAVVFTSAAGVEFSPLDHLAADWQYLPCFCVGEATAAMAARVGWRRILQGLSDGAALAEYVVAELGANATILHPHGLDHHSEPTRTLRAAGMQVLAWPVYEAVAAEALSLADCLLLGTGQCRGVTFFSPRSAKIFGLLLRQAGLEDSVKTMTAYTLGPAIATEAALSSWNKIITPPLPAMASFLEVLSEDYYSQAKHGEMKL